MLTGCSLGDTKVTLPRCYIGATSVLPRWYLGGTKVILPRYSCFCGVASTELVLPRSWCYRGASEVLPGVTKVLPRCDRGATQVIPGATSR